MAPEGGFEVDVAGAEDWKKQGGEAYALKEWTRAAQCYSSALERSEKGSDLALACLNNRAACYAQLKKHEAVVKDTSEVINSQPANVKALFRRMTAYEGMGKREEALKDAAEVLTMEPKNKAALEVVARKRASLNKTGKEDLSVFAPDRPTESLCVMLFTEDNPLQCYACLRSLLKHAKGAVLNICVFWQATSPECVHSYQLLQGLHETTRVRWGRVSWFDCGKGQLFPTFSRCLNKISTEGMQYVMLLSETVVFHSTFDARAALAVLGGRREAWTVRLDLNPRIEFFPEAKLIASAPHLQHFSGDPRILLWTRWYDKSKAAYEAVPREMGWDAILDWTATIVRAEHVQHFFSALLPPLNDVVELDEKAADWLSRRQRMKRSEISQRSACYESSMLVTIDPNEFGGESDALLRAHLFKIWGPEENGGLDRYAKLSEQLGWKLPEIESYFSKAGAPQEQRLEALLNPSAYAQSYLSTVRVSSTPPCVTLPKAVAPRPLVSWLVPVRNSECFVIDCLASIEAQVGLGAGACEVVFVDDGSEDNTLAVLRRLAEHRPHVKIIENAVQLGVSGALVEGWPFCRGDYIARLDADDEAEPERLLRQLRYLQQHPSITALGSKTRPFWTEQRKCTVEKVAEKEDGSVVAVVWREDFGNQTSRKREQIIVKRDKDRIRLVDAPAEYHGCEIVRIGEESMALNPERFASALKEVQGKNGDVILMRRDPLEPPKGSRALHPLRVRALLLFEDCVNGSTVTFNKTAHLPDKCPFEREEAETAWCMLGMEPGMEVANLADALVRSRRHAACRADRDATKIYESRLAAVQHHLTKTFGVEADIQDAAALANFRGPRTPEQGEKLCEMLQQIERSYLSEIVRPANKNTAFFEDYVKGREVALERMLFAQRNRFKEVSDRISAVITSVPDKSPRETRSRTPPR